MVHKAARIYMGISLPGREEEDAHDERDRQQQKQQQKQQQQKRI